MSGFGKKRKRKNKNPKSPNGKKDNKMTTDNNGTSDSESEDSVVDEVDKKRKVSANSVKSNNQNSALLSASSKASSSKSVNTKSKRIPPIVLPDSSVEDTFKILKTLEIVEFRLQKISLGTKILFETTENYNKTKQFCKENGRQFYTFDLPDNKTTKIVVYGVGFLSSDDIACDLKEKNCSPLHISVLTPKINPQNRLFVLTFRKNSDEFVKFKEQRDICKIVFKWKHYVRKNSAVSQCHNCQMMGHGSKNCNCDPKCVRCGDPHKSTDCPRKDPDTKKIQQAEVKCANCQQNHTANYSQCPKRLEFINIQKSLQNKNAKPKPQNKVVPSSSAYTGDALFSQIVKESHQNSKLHSDFTKISSQTPPQSNNVKVRLMKNHDMFNSSEILAIFEELLSKLSACESKADQLKATVEVIAKYLFPNLDGESF